jgi:arginyl-tRNA synthetase
MKPVIDILEEKISQVILEATGQKAPAIVRPAADAKFGDYQANGIMGLAKKLKTNPRKLAEQVVEKLDLSDYCQKPEIAGPGFINLRLKPEFLSDALLEINSDTENHLGVSKTDTPQTVVVDFSGPNIAKQMHVGHLRSTIIGDCICRILEFLGHDVKRQNHIGDWGTQFGMMIACRFYDKTSERIEKVFGDKPEDAFKIIENTEQLYREAKKEYDSDPDFAKLSKDYVVSLHKGDTNTLKYWKDIVELSRSEIYPIYESLRVTLTQKDERGESFYNPFLSKIVEDLKKKDLAVESDGAMCVFPEGFKNKEGEPLPLIVQKSDGAFLYATTDLAAIRYRVNELKADKIVYVTDARQGLHFEMVFEVAKEAGWKQDTELVHVTFGSVLGENGKPLKTRSGENVKLKELLDEAVERAKSVVQEKNPELPQDKKDQIANAVGIGAVKYADYSNNRTSDYIFSFDKMLAMDGNTSPYMQYAYARIKSIEKKGGIDYEKELKDLDKLNLNDPAELDLAKYLIRYGEVIESAAADYRPNYLTTYLFELAQKFSTFYTNCPVLKADPAQRPTRLLLCDLTAKTIKHGLTELLGIEVVEQM